MQRQFYSKEQYLLYNMFNHYFFDGDPGLQVYHKFLESSKDKLAVVVDPPFGGKTELLSNTLNMISQEYQRLHGDGAQDISSNHTFKYLQFKKKHSVNSNILFYSVCDITLLYGTASSGLSSKPEDDGLQS